jgi:predicted acetyltransferase
MGQEELINELSEQLAEEWYSAEDWGEDKFTEVMCNDEIPSDIANVVFEATCYYVVQNLVYSERIDILEEIAKARGYTLTPLG